MSKQDRGHVQDERFARVDQHIERLQKLYGELQEELASAQRQLGKDQPVIQIGQDLSISTVPLSQIEGSEADAPKPKRRRSSRRSGPTPSV